MSKDDVAQQPEAGEVVQFQKSDFQAMTVKDNSNNTVLGQLSGYGIQMEVNTDVVTNVKQVETIANTIAEGLKQSMLNDLIGKAGEGEKLKKTLEKATKAVAIEEKKAVPEMTVDQDDVEEVAVV